MTYVPKAQRVLCPGCSAALELRDDLTLVTCPYCATQSRIVRQLRRAEPRFSWELLTPEKKPDTGLPPSQWSVEELLYGLNTGQDSALTQEILEALDRWPRVREENLKWLPPLLNSLPHLPQERQVRAAGLVGKFLCSQEPELKRQVLDMLPEYLALPKGNAGVVFACSLANSAAVRMLLDTARQACEWENFEYAQKALEGVRTAIGREHKERRVAVCILIHHLFDFPKFMAEWTLKFLRHQFDVGYRDILGEVLEALDDALEERPDLVEGLLHALKKCGRPKSSEDLQLRLTAHRHLKRPESRKEAAKLIVPPYPLEQEQVDMVFQSLALLAQDKTVASSLAKFVWEAPEIRPEHLATLESLRPLPRDLETALSSRERAQ